MSTEEKGKSAQSLLFRRHKKDLLSALLGKGGGGGVGLFVEKGGSELNFPNARRGKENATAHADRVGEIPAIPFAKDKEEEKKKKKRGCHV